METVKDKKLRNATTEIRSREMVAINARSKAHGHAMMEVALKFVLLTVVMDTSTAQRSVMMEMEMTPTAAIPPAEWMMHGLVKEV